MVTTEDELLTALPESDILYLQKEITPTGSEKMGNILASSNRLKWLDWGYTGPDRLRPFESLWNQFHLTTSKGLMAGTIADYVMMVIHILHREFLKVMRNQRNRVWERWPFNSPRGKTIGIIGLGSIGKEVARRAKCFEMNVIGLVRRPVSPDNVDAIFLQTELREFLGRSDVVVLSAPLTPETRGLIGEEAIRWMKPGSYLVNIARGRIVDEEALVKALKSGHLAGAALDAFVRNPSALRASSGPWRT